MCAASMIYTFSVSIWYSIVVQYEANVKSTDKPVVLDLLPSHWHDELGRLVQEAHRLSGYTVHVLSCWSCDRNGPATCASRLGDTNGSGSATLAVPWLVANASSVADKRYGVVHVALCSATTCFSLCPTFSLYEAVLAQITVRASQFGCTCGFADPVVIL
jgi:hypothetical protein